MNDSYIPGLTNSMRHMAVGGAVTPQALELQEAAKRAYEGARLASFGATGELSPELAAMRRTRDFNYSPAALDYMQGVQDYQTSQDTGYNLTPMNVGTAVDLQTGAPLPLTNAQLEQYAQQPVADQFYANFNYSQPGGWDVGNLQFAPNQQYRLVDRATGDVVYSGTGYEAGQNISNLAKGMFDKSGQQANWAVEQAAPGSTDWSTRYAHEPDVNGFLTYLKMVGPMIGGALAAPLGISGAIGAGAGAAGAGVAAGDSFTDILKNTALAAGTTYAFDKLAPYLKLNSLAPTVGNTVGSAVGSAAQGGITVLAPVASKAGAIAGSIASNVGNTASNKPATKQPTSNPNAAPPTVDTTPIVSIGKPAANVGLGGAGALGAVGAGLAPNVVNPPQVTQPPAQEAPVDQASEDDIIEVRKMLDRGISSTELMAMGIPAVTITAATAASGGAGAGSTATSNTAPSNTNGPTNLLEGTPYNNTGILDKLGGLPLSEQIRLGLLAAGTVAGAFGGGGDKGTPGTIPGGLGGGLDAMFNAKLPAANIALPVARPAANIDYKRYGYGPEQSFFTNVPQGAPNTSTAYTGYEDREGLARGGQPKPRDVLPMVEGNIDLRNRPIVRNGDGSISTVKSRSFNFDGIGEVLLPTVSEDGRIMPDAEAVEQFRRTGRHLGVFTTPEEATEYGLRLHDDQEREYVPRSNFAVGGPGHGRSDEIPAMLSDGEYVIDAETVALLGNGSSKAGAKALDAFRVNVRKQKGRKLAKGEFSVNAKRPEQYLKGRK